MAMPMVSRRSRHRPRPHSDDQTASLTGWAERKPDADILITDIRNALKCVERRWPGPVDTLCCGTLGSVEFFHEAGGVLGRDDLGALAAQRLRRFAKTRFLPANTNSALARASSISGFFAVLPASATRS